MSIFENPFHKKTPAERIEPPPLSPQRTSLYEQPGQIEPPSPPQPETNAFALPPETLEQEAARKFEELALKLNMSADDLRNLDKYPIGGGLYGIRGKLNGQPIDLKQMRQPAHGNTVEITGHIDGDAIRRINLSEEFARLGDAVARRSMWERAVEVHQEEHTLARVQGAEDLPSPYLAEGDGAHLAVRRAHGPESRAEQEIEDEFNAIAERFKMSIEELHALERYKTDQEEAHLYGVRGMQNGVPFDIRQQANPLSLSEVHLWGSIGGKEMSVNSYELGQQWGHITAALKAREEWERNAESKRTGAVVQRMRGAA